MYIDGIGNETTRKMRLYSMYVISFQIKGKGIYKGKLSIELDETVKKTFGFNSSHYQKQNKLIVNQDIVM